MHDVCSSKALINLPEFFLSDLTPKITFLPEYCLIMPDNRVSLKSSLLLKSSVSTMHITISD